MPAFDATLSAIPLHCTSKLEEFGDPSATCFCILSKEQWCKATLDSILPIETRVSMESSRKSRGQHIAPRGAMSYTSNAAFSTREAWKRSWEPLLRVFETFVLAGKVHVGEAAFANHNPSFRISQPFFQGVSGSFRIFEGFSGSFGLGFLVLKP